MNQKIASILAILCTMLPLTACEAPSEPPAVCGDGLLDTGAGEVVEVNFDACVAAGFFGGVSTTDDCLTLSERYCGDFRLHSAPASVKFPVLTQDADGAPWIAGVVQGDFDGPSCAPEPLTWTTRNIDEGTTSLHEDGFHYADCDRTFFGHLGDARAPGVTLALDEATPPQRVLSLGAAGFAMVRHHPDPDDPDYVIDWLSPQGARVHTETVRHDGDRGQPQLVRNGDDEFALVTGTRFAEVLKISRFSIASPGLLQTSELTSVAFEDDPWGPDPYQRSFRVLGVSPGVYRAVISLGTLHNHREYFLLTFEAVTATVAVLDTRRLNLFAFEIAHFGTADDGDLLKLVWTDGVEENAYRFSVGWLDLEGALLSSTQYPLPTYHYPAAIFGLPDGGWIAGGMRDYSEELLTPPETSCDLRPRQNVFGHLFAARFLADGTLTGLSHFYSPVFDYTNQYDDTAATAACDTAHVRYALDGDALLIAGVYDQADFFCTAAEPAARHRGQPLHACGAYLVRLDPP